MSVTPVCAVIWFCSIALTCVLGASVAVRHVAFPNITFGLSQIDLCAWAALILFTTALPGLVCLTPAANHQFGLTVASRCKSPLPTATLVPLASSQSNAVSAVAPVCIVIVGFVTLMTNVYPISLHFSYCTRLFLKSSHSCLVM